jgi:hypothetical protein
VAFISWFEGSKRLQSFPLLSWFIPILDSSATPGSFSKVVERSECFLVIATVSDAFPINLPVIIKQPKTMNQVVNVEFAEVQTAH